MFGPTNKEFLNENELNETFYLQAVSMDVSFFDNYIAHARAKSIVSMDYLQRNAKYTNAMNESQKIAVFASFKSTCMHFAPIIGELCFELSQQQASFMERLYDRYDYCDTVLQATIVPIVKVLLAAASLLAAIISFGVYLYQQCMILSGLKENDLDNDADSVLSTSKNMASQLAIASASLLFTAVTDFINGGIGMLTRPLSTAILGYKEPTTHDNDAAVSYRFAFFKSDYVSTAKQEPVSADTPAQSI